MTSHPGTDDGSHAIAAFWDYYNGQRFEFRVTWALLEATPIWPAQEPHPPLAARRAIHIATNYLAQLVDEAERWRLEEVCLEPLGRTVSGFWVYAVRFSGFHPPGVSDGAVPTMRVIVLMNGETIEPVVTEQRSSR